MNQFNLNKLKQTAIEIISLSSPKGRLIFFGLVSSGIFFSKYDWFNDLSLWKSVGWESAPSIGLTRAYWLLLHGRPVDAWNRNPLIYPVLIIVLTLVIIDFIKIKKLKNSKSK